jgi:predicted nuclease with RNAse H fold
MSEEQTLKMYELANKLRDANIEFLKIAIRDFDTHIDILAELNSDDMFVFRQKLELSGFGVSEVNPKKKEAMKTSNRITSKNSKDGVTHKRK